jgi:hypothetical protein
VDTQPSAAQAAVSTIMGIMFMASVHAVACAMTLAGGSCALHRPGLLCHTQLVRARPHYV